MAHMAVGGRLQFLAGSWQEDLSIGFEGCPRDMAAGESRSKQSKREGREATMSFFGLRGHLLLLPP